LTFQTDLDSTTPSTHPGSPVHIAPHFEEGTSGEPPIPDLSLAECNQFGTTVSDGEAEVPVMPMPISSASGTSPLVNVTSQDSLRIDQPFFFHFDLGIDVNIDSDEWGTRTLLNMGIDVDFIGDQNVEESAGGIRSSPFGPGCSKGG
jgi:hypothetical protein